MKNPFTGMFTRTSDPHSDIKSSQPLVALELSNSASWTPRHYSALAKEGFQKNPVAYRCIRLVAEAAASVPLYASAPELQTLLSRGHPGQTGADVMESFYGYLQLSGNAYLEAGMIGGAPAALYALRPDRMSVQTAKNGWPCGYSYDSGQGQSGQGQNGRREFRCDTASGRTPIFHMRLLHPSSDTQGFPPLEAAAQAIDIHNEGGRWTKALLDNSARPSGALIYKAGEGAQMSDDQFARIKAELEGAYAGARHAGRPMVLEGGLEWRSMSLSPADMDFREARRDAAREIALALGVPPMLLGIPGDNTYGYGAELPITL